MGSFLEMRDSPDAKKAGVLMSKQLAGGQGEVAYDSKSYFESYYRATLRDKTPTDKSTIGLISEMESRFHYNAVENAIIHAVCKRSPPPPSPLVEAWKTLQLRRELRLLDLGSGTGHWIDFMREVLYVSHSVGIEITAEMSIFLKEKYLGDNVLILDDDVTNPNSLSVDSIGGPVDYVTAIGIMFHIVDDTLWRQAIRNIARVLCSGGLAFIGGDFGAETKNIEFAKTEDFDDWREYAKLKTAGPSKVTKRVRSLSDWHRVTTECGLEIVDIVRAERESRLSTPENDILVLMKPEE